MGSGSSWRPDCAGSEGHLRPWACPLSDKGTLQGFEQWRVIIRLKKKTKHTHIFIDFKKAGRRETESSMMRLESCPLLVIKPGNLVMCPDWELNHDLLVHRPMLTQPLRHISWSLALILTRSLCCWVETSRDKGGSKRSGEELISHPGEIWWWLSQDSDREAGEKQADSEFIFKNRTVLP